MILNYIRATSACVRPRYLTSACKLVLCIRDFTDIAHFFGGLRRTGLCCLSIRHSDDIE